MYSRLGMKAAVWCLRSIRWEARRIGLKVNEQVGGGGLFDQQEPSGNDRIAGFEAVKIES